VIKFEKNKLVTYDLNGEKLWEKELKMKDPIIRGNKDNIVVVNPTNGKVFYIDYRGEIKLENSLDKEVIDVEINSNGYVLTMLKKEIFVFHPNGEIVSNFNIPKGEVFDGDLSEDNNTIALTILNVEEKKFYSNILFYSLDGKVLAGKKYDNDIIYKIFLINDSNLLALSDSRVLMISEDDKNNNVIWVKEFEENLNKGVLSDQGILVLSLINKENTIIDTKNRNIICQLNLDGNILNKTPIAGEVLGLDVIDDEILVFTDRTIYILDKKGEIILERKINRDIKTVKWISKKNILITYKDRLEIMSLDN
ncbi:MAG: DUF5711 family protein, partial [Clostridia bacterium]|nr:DUF5711 family protein [Clostridia bacterium]